MIIDNLTGTRVFVEKRTPLTISINSQQNNDGLLRIDDVQNPLITKIDSGDTNLGRLEEYTGTHRMMFYNEKTKKIRLVSVGETINLSIDFEQGTKFFIGGRKIYGKLVSDGTFSADIQNSKIFKIFLDTGREIKSYTTGNNTITLLGVDRLCADKLSELIIYTYDSSDIGNYRAKISYYGFNTIFDIDSFMSNEYFDNEFAGEELYCFDAIEVVQNTTKDIRRYNFSNSNKYIINSIENTVNIDLFDGNDVVDMIQYVGADEFRFCFVNSSFGRTVLINNCKIIDGVSFSFEKERNTKKVSISCGNYIDIKLSSQGLYGKGWYGKGLYGEGTWITNSSRRGV